MSRSSGRRPTTSSRTGRAPASHRARSVLRVARRGRTSRRRSTRSACFGSSTTATRRSSPPTRRLARGDRATVGEVVDAGVLPVVLGGDHSITEPNVRAVATRRGPVGLLHFDTHADTGTEVFGVERSHGTPMYRLVEAGHVDPARYVQIGLRGYWPTEKEFAWQARARDHVLLHARRPRPGDPRSRRGRARTARRGPVYVTVDIDVLDPASRPAPERPSPAV